MRTQRLRKLLLVLVALLAMALVAPTDTLEPTRAQHPGHDHFEFTFGDVPDGWLEFDYSEGTSGDPLVNVTFILPDPTTRLPLVFLSVSRNSTAEPITMDQCLGVAHDFDALIDDVAGQAWFRIAARTETAVSHETIGGYDATITQTYVEVDEWVPGSGAPRDLSPGGTPASDDQASPEPSVEHPPYWERLSTVWARAYCVDHPAGAVMIRAAAQPDYWWQVAEFVDTLKFGTPSPEVPLCDEARTFFSHATMLEQGYPDDDSPTTLRLNLAQLDAQILDAVGAYNELRPDARAHRSPETSGALAVADWLVTPAGMTYTRSLADVQPFDEFSRASTFAHDAGPGDERDLYRAILDRFEATGQRLEPGEVYLLALIQTDGDARLAALLAHNTLRSLAAPGDRPFTNLPEERAFFTQYVSTFRGVPGNEVPEDRYDNAGVWVHLFASMYFAIATDGDVGPFTTMALPLMEIAPRAAQLIADSHLPDFGPNHLDPAYRASYEAAATPLSRGIAMSEIDPQRLCVSVWGAQIGTRLVETLGKGPEQTDSLTGASLPQSPTRHAMASLPDLLLSPDWQGGLPNAFALAGPVSIAWETAAGTMVLDQRSNGLHGYAPAFVIPVFDTGDGSLGAQWFDYHDAPYRLAFVGTDRGELRLTQFRNDGGTAATWMIDIGEGERLTLDIAPGSVNPPLVHEDGTRISPTIVTLPRIEGLSPSPPSLDDPEEPVMGLGIPLWAVLLLLGLAGLAALAGVFVIAVIIVLAVRGRRARREGAPWPPTERADSQ
jgi:hypothetical protein